MSSCGEKSGLFEANLIYQTGLKAGADGFRSTWHVVDRGTHCFGAMSGMAAVVETWVEEWEEGVLKSRFFT